MNTNLFFNILNKTVFAVLAIVLLGLLLITPADAIRQALENRQLYNVFVIAGTYFVTVFFAIMIYASRLWTSNTVLKAIPKTYIPVEKGDVGEKVRKMIEGGLKRSAAIAWMFRPRADTQIEAAEAEAEGREPVAQLPEAQERNKWMGVFRKKLSGQEKDDHAMIIPPYKPNWDAIAHDGWSSPLSPDLPNIQYISVIQELPNLVEAKAVSVAPPDPSSTSDPPMPDLRAVELLTRPLSMGLRDYIEHLIRLDIITSLPTATAFLDSYEHARFSAQPLSEAQFRDLMKLFSELLRTMKALSPDMLLSSLNDESDASDDDSLGTPTSASMLSFRTVSTRSGSAGTVRTTRSRPGPPASPRSKKRPKIRKSASANSFAQSRRVYEPGDSGSGSGSGSSNPPSVSLARSSSQGSVIRLNTSHQEGELPYTLTPMPSR
jgi:hypothetical protein